jgi:hypothetical protein
VAPAANWIGAGDRSRRYDWEQGAFGFLPPGADWFLIGAFAAYSGAGGSAT